MASELIKVIELDPIEMGEEQASLHFRIEIFRKLDRKRSYYARICRWEIFRIQPAFPIRKPRGSIRLADEEILITDVMFQQENFESTSEKKTYKRVQQRLHEIFGRDVTSK